VESTPGAVLADEGDEMSEKFEELLDEIEKETMGQSWNYGKARAAVVSEYNRVVVELAALKESTRWIPVDYEPAPKDLDNYGACSDVEGNAYWVRKPTEAK
jgi:hypothetical protein